MTYVGYTGVANLANTSPGSAKGTVANAYNGWGDDVGDHGVVDLYGPVSPPLPEGFILMENSGYVLQQDNSKIQLESGAQPILTGYLITLNGAYLTQLNSSRIIVESSA